MSEQGEVALGKIVETHVVYEDLEDLAQTGTDFTSSAEFTDSEEGNCECTDSNEECSCGPKDDDEDKKKCETITASLTTEEENTATIDQSAEAAVADPKVSAASENENQQEDTSTASFANSERAELEALKREKKVALLESYNDSLTDEVKANLINELDTLTLEELELKLLKIYKEKAEEETFSAKAVPFAVPEPQKVETGETKLNSYIRRMLRK